MSVLGGVTASGVTASGATASGDTASMTPTRKFNTQSLVNHDLAGKVESSGFLEMDNGMTVVFQCKEVRSRDNMVTVVHTFISGVTNNDCTIYFPNPNDSGTTQKMHISTKWPERFLDARTVFWTPHNKYTDYDMHPEAIAYAESVENFQIMQK